MVRLIVRQGMLQLAIGMTAGLGIAAFLGQSMSFILFDVQPRDPQIFGGVVMVLAAVGLAACLIPALRATRVAPTEALHTS